MQRRNQERWIERVLMGSMFLAVFFIFGSPMIEDHKDGKIVTSSYYQPSINYNLAQLEAVK